MDFELVAILILAVLFLARWHYEVRRFRSLEKQLAEMTNVKEDLQRLLVRDDTLMDKKIATTPKEVPQATAVVAPQPVEKKSPVAASTPATGAELDDSVVAVIMAAVAAYGYPPSAIRSIRPQVRRNQRRKWTLAGRLAGMRR